MQEGVETVAVSQTSVVSEMSAAVVSPVAVGAAAVFPPTVQDLARYLSSLIGELMHLTLKIFVLVRVLVTCHLVCLNDNS